MKGRIQVSLLVLSIGALLFAAPIPLAPASAATAQSTISVYANCPSAISFASTSTSACDAGNFSSTAVYTGVSEIVAPAQDSVFYISSATGGVKVTFSLTDVTTGKMLLSGTGYGSLSGGTCADPSVIVPTQGYLTFTSNEINTGDTINATIDIVFTGTGSPTLCSGGGSATLISFSTTFPSGSPSPDLTTELTAGASVQTTLGGYVGDSEAYTNTGTAAVTAIVLGVLENSQGQTVAVLSTSISLSGGQTVTAFLPIYAQYPSGSYTMTTIALTSTSVIISTASTATMSL